MARHVYVSSPLVNNPARYHHKFDGIATKHNDGFRNTKRFQLAYSRAVRAGGFDYRIPWRVHQCLWCAEQARKVDGDFVEFGTGRGFMMSALLTDFSGWDSCGRQMWLFDTFLPYRLGADGKQDVSGAINRYYAESIEDVRRNFAEWSHIRLVQGDVIEILPQSGIGKIAFLHLDLNNARAEALVLQAIWDKVQVGGVILMDDYAFAGCEDQYRALNEVASSFGFHILTTPTGQGIVIK